MVAQYPGGIPFCVVFYHRAEVGLLSHNVVVEGALQSDPQGILGQGADQYGAQIFIHRMGPNVAPVK